MLLIKHVINILFILFLGVKYNVVCILKFCNIFGFICIIRIYVKALFANKGEYL